MKLFYRLNPKYDKDPRYIIRLWTGLSGPFATFLNRLHISANAVTSLRGIFVLYAIYCFSTGEYIFYWQGSILLMLNQFLDAVDGDIARISKSESFLGEWLEMIIDNPLSAVCGLVVFGLAWGIYKQTSMIEVWYVIFFIPYGELMNSIFSSFAGHKTEDATIMQKGFQSEYYRVMKYSFFKKLYFNVLCINEQLILLCVIFYYPIYDYLGIHRLFLAFIINCVFIQTKWLSRILLQLRFLAANGKR